MAKPPTANAFPQALGPADTVDFYVILAQGASNAAPAPLLLLGEAVASYHLALSPEAVAAGLMIVESAGYAPTLTGNLLKLWLAIADDMGGSSLFDGSGVTVGIEVTVTTTADPARTKQRTFLIKVAQQ